jgi:hypothetical protein
MLGYRTVAGHTQRVPLATGVFDKDRVAAPWRRQTAMGLAFESIWWLLTVLAMSFIGLWSIWAGLGRPNWFVRMAVVLGWISLVLVIPAYELLVLFLVQAGVTIALLSVWRAWHFPRIAPAGPDELPSGSLPQSRWQYSVRDLLLLAVLVAWLAAMLTRVPALAWMQSRAWLLTGGLAPAAAWIALSRRRWWLRLPVACVLFPSLLVVVWLMLARAAGFVRTNSKRSIWTTWVSRAALVSVTLLIILPLAAIYWRLATPLPIPQTTLPNPNGYDDLVQAGKMLQSVTVPYLGPEPHPVLKIATHAQLKAFGAQFAPVDKMLQTGLAKPCQVPVIWNDPEMTWYFVEVSNFSHFHQLARALCAKAKLAELDGRLDDAVAADLDNIRLGTACAHGGLEFHGLIAECFTGMGREGICGLRKSLSKKQCVTLVPALIDLMLQEEPLEDRLDRDAAWIDNAQGWMGRLGSAINAVTGADQAMFWQICGTAVTMRQFQLRIRDRDLAKMRLLICDLAIRGYSLDRGRYPVKLADLVPDFLPEVPKDPFSGGPFAYRPTPKGYLLYSVGVNGVDDGGKNSSSAGLGEDGDILLDDSPSPPPTP